MTRKTAPGEARLMAALEATWPPAETVEAAGFRLRRGGGGGKRVSAASPLGPSWDQAGIEAAVTVMAAWGQAPLFQLTGSAGDLDHTLAGDGFEVVDPTVLYLASAANLAGEDPLPVAHARDLVPVLMEEIWAQGGIGPGRLAVMERFTGPSVRLLGRAGDRPAGAAFVAVEGDVAMIHAIEVLPNLRRQGVARQLMQAGARFALAHNAPWLALAVTEANGPARALYEALGMVAAGRYHYRIQQEAEAQ